MAIGTPTDLGGSNIAALATTNTISLTTTGTASAGDKVIVVVGSSTVNRSLLSVSDNVGGNTYTIDKTQNDPTNAENCYVASCTLTNGISSGKIITATFASSLSSVRGICAFTIIQVGALDIVNGNQGTGSGWDGGTTGTLNASNELLIGAGWRSGATTSTPSSSQSMTELFDFNGSSRTMSVVYRVVSSNASLLPGGVWASSGQRWQGVTATYQQAAGEQSSTLSPTAVSAASVPRVVSKSFSNF